MESRKNFAAKKVFAVRLVAQQLEGTDKSDLTGKARQKSPLTVPKSLLPLNLSSGFPHLFNFSTACQNQNTIFHLVGDPLTSSLRLISSDLLPLFIILGSASSREEASGTVPNK
ncbi:hypothetical protein AGOR_G00029060 [Albula goreensis]|uniref:Uncharacterized protein n=1 Tax=Albula goreensis TaxID=1534307 RepID=A0A8T3E9M9_9TELE|nr:hypothetical protein AGOR_G00029060 [Albula goreensis]